MDGPRGAARRTRHMPAWNAQFASHCCSTLSTAPATMIQCRTVPVPLLYRSVKAESLVSNTEAEFGSVCAA
jgi:hypothetical protein